MQQRAHKALYERVQWLFGALPFDRLHRAVVLPLVRHAFRDIYADLALMEEEIRNAALRWTVVRPPQLTDRPGTGRWQLREDTAVPGRLRIARADLATAMPGMVDDPTTERKIIGVAN
ncbi:NAD(P)H-binding protein [Streptomyces sp. NPDC007083]|uniref:NAD(P)-dependent oxidoreductase n=1 Tax=Streptomyces sp. NPDC007083 TaxID=3156913 RepID=UPI0033EC27E6